MSDLLNNLKKLKYDKRMINWNLKQKVITKEEYEKHLKGLEDMSDLKETMKEVQEKSKPEHSS